LKGHDLDYEFVLKQTQSLINKVNLEKECHVGKWEASRLGTNETQKKQHLSEKSAIAPLRKECIGIHNSVVKQEDTIVQEQDEIKLTSLQ
jgi:hypothetical protein